METILSSKQKYQGKIVSVSDIDIDFGNGKQAVFEKVEFIDGELGVMMVALDEVMNIYLIKQYQAGSNARLIVLPRGGLKPGVSPIDMARQELQEEIGLNAKKIKQLAVLDIFPGIIRAKSILFLAQGLSPKRLQGDEFEDIEIIKIPFSEAVKDCLQNKITDARTVAAILFVNEYLKN